MAKAAARKKTPEDLVLQALQTALQRGGELRLVTSGKKPENVGLFADEKTTNASAIAVCLGDPPLLRVVRTETVKAGKKISEHRFVVLTPQGVDYLTAHLPAAGAARLLKGCVDKTTDQLKGLEESLARMNEARENLEGVLGAYVRELRSVSGRVQSEADALRDHARGLQTRLDGLPVSGPPFGLTEGEYDFVRRLVQHMVFAYQEAPPEARLPIERALFNAGVQRIGKTGERVSFDGRLHESPDSVFQDDPAEIIQSGWLLLEKDGEYLLAKAKVKALPLP